MSSSTTTIGSSYGFVFVAHRHADGTSSAELYVKSTHGINFGFAHIVDAAKAAGLPYVPMVQRFSEITNMADPSGPLMFVIDRQGQLSEAWKSKTAWRTLRQRLVAQAGA